MLESKIVAGSPYFGGNPTHLLLAEQSRGLEDQTNILCSEGMNLTVWYESYSGVGVFLWSMNSSFGLGVRTRTVSVTRASQQDSAPYACSRLQQLSESVTPRKSTLKI